MKKQSSAQIKKMIRDTKRLNNHSPSPALESKLSILMEQLQDQQSAAKMMKMQQKYKYVKFVEKKKLLRRLNTLEKECKDSSDLDLIRLHLAYIDHYPSDLKYISIISSENSDEAQEKKNAILGHLRKGRQETGKWPMDWEYSVVILGRCKTQLQPTLTDDFFL